MPLPTLRLATAHLSPHLLSTPATLQKTLSAITHASHHRASLICFPESFIPCFPIWSALLPPSHPSTHSFFAKFVEQSIYADGPEITAIREKAKEGRIAVSLGFSEKARYSSGTLWNSNVVIDEGGDVKVHHRKLVPTFFERLSWGAGDGEGLRTAEIGVRKIRDAVELAGSKGGGESESGSERVKIGALICGENTNPLARYTMMSQGEMVHVSTWPAVWPTRMPTPPTSSDTTTNGTEQKSQADGKKAKGKNYDNILANRLRAGAHCFEAKAFGIMCAAHLSESNIEALISMLDPSDKAMIETFRYALQNSSQAASMFLDPTGTPVPAFTINEKGEMQEKEMLRDEEGVLLADIDLQECVEGKQYHDVVGGYQRLDVFELKVDRRRRKPVTFTDLQEGFA